MYAIISQTGRATEGLVSVPNNYFNGSVFYDREKKRPLSDLGESTQTTIAEWEASTGIRQRMHPEPGQTSSGLAINATKNMGDYENTQAIISTHNFGDAEYGNPEVDWLPGYALQRMREWEMTGKGHEKRVGLDLLCEERDLSTIAGVLSRSSNGRSRLYCGNVNELDPASLPWNCSSVPETVVHAGRLNTDHASLASRIASGLGIPKPPIALDFLWGCGGYLIGLSYMTGMIEAGIIDRGVLTASEVLPRVGDPFHKGSMMWGAAGASSKMIAGDEHTPGLRIVSCVEHTHAEYSDVLTLGRSYNPADERAWLCMNGRAVFKYMVKTMPQIMRETLALASKKLEKQIEIDDVKLIAMHQPQKRMILDMMRIAFGMDEKTTLAKVPIIADTRGNSSVAPIPEILDGVFRRELGDYHLERGDLVLMPSAGASMNAACAVGIMQ